MPTYPLPTLAATVTSAGITAPPYSDIYQSLQASFQSIYGSDAYIDPDSQDGQMLAVFAKAISDGNDADIEAFNSFSPSTAQRGALTSNVKINGIARGVPTNSQVTVRVSGVVGTIVSFGQVADEQGNVWNLPDSVVIPTPAAFIDVTATADQVGAIAADIGTITRIVNPQLGWQAATNTTAASLGSPVEPDAALRQRQAVSTALPTQTVLSGTLGAILNLPGVTQARVYENDTDAPDANGQPEHSIAAMVIGGTSTDIANAILMHKTPGAYTSGSTAVAVTDPANGMPYTIRYSVPTPVPLAVAITVKALAGYTTSVGQQIVAALVGYVNGLGIGNRSDLGRLYLPAQLFGAADSLKFEVNVLQQSIKPAVPSAADVDIAFNAIATLLAADVALTVT